MTLKERFEALTEWFMAHNPDATTELHYGSPYELLVATMLSAQCTDARVNATMPSFMEKFPDPESLAKAEPEDVLAVIRSISYPNAKSRHLVAMARKVVSDFGGKIPETVDKLVTLSGVGTKTANVLTSVIYDNPVIAVDTHVFRVSHKMGLSEGKTPVEVEKDLEKGFATDVRPRAHHWLLLHGRYTCKARKPLCGECPLTAWCLYNEKQQ